MDGATLQTNQSEFSKLQMKPDQPLSAEIVYDFNNNYTTEQYFDEINDWLNDHYGTNYELN